MANYVSAFFENMRNMYVNKIIIDILPLWLTQNWLYQLIVSKSLARTVDQVAPFTEYILEKIKEHRATLDFANPKDFLGNFDYRTVLNPGTHMLDLDPYSAFFGL